MLVMLRFVTGKSHRQFSDAGGLQPDQKVDNANASSTYDRTRQTHTHTHTDKHSQGGSMTDTHTHTPSYSRLMEQQLDHTRSALQLHYNPSSSSFAAAPVSPNEAGVSLPQSQWDTGSSDVPVNTHSSGGILYDTTSHVNGSGASVSYAPLQTPSDRCIPASATATSTDKLVRPMGTNTNTLLNAGGCESTPMSYYSKYHLSKEARASDAVLSSAMKKTPAVKENIPYVPRSKELQSWLSSQQVNECI